MPEENAQKTGTTSLRRRILAVAAVAGFLLLGTWLIRVAMPLPERGLTADAEVFPAPPEGETLAAQRGEDAVTYHFRSPLRPGEMLQYYRVAMRELGWTPRDLRGADPDGSLLAFSRGNQTCIMRVSEAGAETAVTAVVQLRPVRSPLRDPYEQRTARPSERSEDEP